MNPVSDHETIQRRTTSDPKAKRLALFGMFGVGNLGNECTLQAMLHNVHRFLPDAQVCCICAGPDDTTLSYHVPAFPIREMSLSPLNNRLLRLVRRLFVGTFMELLRWLKAIRMLRGTNMLVMTGTGMLSDLDILPLGLHYDILRWSIVSKLCRCKLMFVSVGAGPIRHPLSRFFLRTALGMADYRSYRDAFSKIYLAEMGVSTEGDAVYPDLAFSLPKSMLFRPRDSRGIVVGIGLITNDKRRSTLEKVDALYQDYITKLGIFVSWLIKQNYRVRLLVGDVAYDSRARQDLMDFLEQRGLSNGGGQIIDEPVRSVDELLSQLAGTDLVVASRFHNVLLALMLRKPVVAISFHEKVDSLMSAMGFTRFCHDIEHVDVEQLIEQFNELDSTSDDIRRTLDRLSEIYRTALDHQYETILKSPPTHSQSMR
jgi:polysaccharide pyruvyl transferase WcaK-like protein